MSIIVSAVIAILLYALAIWVVGFAGSMGDNKVEAITQATLETTQKLRAVLDDAH